MIPLLSTLIRTGASYGLVAGTAAAVSEATKTTIETGGRIAQANLEAASRESSPVGAVVRSATGISLDAIHADGLLGGDNSEVRRILRGFGL